MNDGWYRSGNEKEDFGDEFQHVLTHGSSDNLRGRLMGDPKGVGASSEETPE